MMIILIKIIINYNSDTDNNTWSKDNLNDDDDVVVNNDLDI